jgi:hypothetical protein
VTAAIVVVTALLLVPGVGAALAFAGPGTLSIESRLALAFGLGYALVAGVATLLALGRVFSLPTFVAGVVLATAGVWVAALRRASPRAHAEALVAQAREAPVALGAGLAVILAVAVTRPLYPAEISLGVRSAWRYWADGLEVAAAGQVPAHTQQWGMEIPTTVSKAGFNAFQGGVSFLLGPQPLPAMYGILFVSAVGLVAALLGLGRELGFGIFAPLVPALTVLVPGRLPLSHEMAKDLKWYTAEDVGRMAAFSALVAAMYVVRAERNRVLPVVTGAALALAALTHLVPALVVDVLLVFYALSTIVRDRPRLRQAVVRAGGIAAVFVVCYGGALALSGGDVGFQRATGEEFTGIPAGVDATRSFARGELTPRREQDGPFLVSPRNLLARYGEQTVDRPGWAWLGLVGVGALGVASVVMVLLARRFLTAAAMAWGLFATTMLVALFFSWRYDTTVPGDWGARRLYDYGVLVPALLVPALLAAISRPWIRGRRTTAAVLAILVGLIGVGAAVNRVPGDRNLGRGKAGLKVIEQVADVVPCGSRMLSNARTAGTWEATTGRRAVTEGMAPFLRPQVMGRVLPVLTGANEFFAHPRANQEFLKEQRVEYLVVVKPAVWIGTNGGRVPGERDAEHVASVPGVDLVHRDRRVAIFAVGSHNSREEDGQRGRCPL